MDNRLRKQLAGVLYARKHRPISGAICGVSSLTKKEMQEHQADGTSPAVYVGTYAKYNNGSLAGQWVNIASFDTYADFMRYLYRLHSDEQDPEFMFQDFENFPESLYSEAGMGEKTFNTIKAIAEHNDNEAFAAFIEEYGNEFDDVEEEFEDRYEGQFDSETDFAYFIVDELGGVENVEHPEYYFDYDAFARDLFINDYEMLGGGYVFRRG